MAKSEDTIDKSEDEELQAKPFSKKKVLIYVLPVIIVIGLVVSFITVFSKKTEQQDNSNYSVVVSNDADGKAEKVTVFYSMPELTAHLRSSLGTALTVKLKMSIELSSLDDIKTVETMLPRINDMLLAHITELTSEEISGSDGLYNLKQELLYRINLLTKPVKVSNLNFKTFDIQKNN